MSSRRGTCRSCGREFALMANGWIRKHRAPGTAGICAGAWKHPARSTS